MFLPTPATRLRFFEQGVDGVGAGLERARDGGDGRLLLQRQQDRLALGLAQRDGLGVEREGATAHVAVAPLASTARAAIATNTFLLQTMRTRDDQAHHTPQSDTLVE